MGSLHFWWMSIRTPDTQLWDLVQYRPWNKHTNMLQKQTHLTNIILPLCSLLWGSLNEKYAAVSCLLSPLHDEVLVPACSHLSSYGHLILHDWSREKPNIVFKMITHYPILSVFCLKQNIWIVGGVDFFFKVAQEYKINKGWTYGGGSCSSSNSCVHSIHSVIVFTARLSMSFFAILCVVDFKSDSIQSDFLPTSSLNGHHVECCQLSWIVLTQW